MSEGKKTLEQKRAQDAWNVIQRIINESDKEARENYAREAKKLPVRILTAGLGQAMAFLEAKKSKKTGLGTLHQDLTRWVIHRGLKKDIGKASLLQLIIENDSDFLRRATDECMAYLQWLNRFAEAHDLVTDEG